MSKLNNVGQFLQNRVYDLVELALYANIPLMFDSVDGKFDWTLECLALGAGLQTGLGISPGFRKSRLITSTIAAGFAIYPDIAQLAATGDTRTFLTYAGYKAFGFGCTMALGRVFTDLDS